VAETPEERRERLRALAKQKVCAKALWWRASALAGQSGADEFRTASSLAVLALAMVPVALLWWVWIRMLD